MAITLHLCAFDAEIKDAWRLVFKDESSVEIELCDILRRSADAVISPANSFGFMDGGIDLAYSHHFGWHVEERVKAKINEDFDGELPVGAAIVVPTDNANIPFLVSAPTMRVPGSIAGTVNVFLAFRAALLAVRRHNELGASPISSVLVPALGAGIGMVPAAVVARQMHAAYREIEMGDTTWRTTARGVLARHRSLLK